MTVEEEGESERELMMDGGGGELCRGRRPVDGQPRRTFVLYTDQSVVKIISAGKLYNIYLNIVTTDQLN